MPANLKIGILGCGYVGKAVAIALKPNHVVTVSTRDPNRLNELTFCAHASVLLENSLDRLLRDQDILMISVAPSQEESYEQCYLKTAQTIAQALPRFPQLKQIIYTSSTSVYGEHAGAWVDEDTIPQPLNEKTQVLLETENLLLSLSSESTAVCILRLGEIFGPQRELTKRFSATERKIFPGSGDHFTNLTHLSDIVHGVKFAINNSLRGVYNLCLDEHPTRKSLYELLCKRNNFPLPLWDSQKQTIHVGNKRVFCGKIKQTGYSRPFQGLE